jgi:hypothetical protein
MAVTFAAPTCWPVQGWAVYRRSGSAWKLVLARRGVFIFPLAVVGSDIRETEPVFRPGDPRCLPSGGRHARIWHWSGKRLVAGAWKVISAGPKTVHLDTFLSPDRRVGCTINPPPNEVVWCATNPPGPHVHFAELQRSPAVTICDRSPTDFCTQNAITKAPVLRLGQQDELHGFRCFSLRSGVKCIVIRSGKGFLINRKGVHRVGA